MLEKVVDFWHGLDEYFSNKKNLDKLNVLSRKTHMMLAYNVLGYKKPYIKTDPETGKVKEPSMTKEVLEKFHNPLFTRLIDLKGVQYQLSAVKSMDNLVYNENGKDKLRFNFGVVQHDCVERIVSTGEGVVPLTCGAVSKASAKCPEGKIFVYADFSAQELAILAVKSGDQNLIEAMKQDDTHSFIASKLFNRTVSRTENVALRNLIKTITFGSLYSCFDLGTIKGIVKSKTNEFTDAELDDALQKYQIYFSTLFDWVQNTLQSTLDNNGVVMYGRGMKKDVGLISQHMTPEQYGRSYNGRLAVSACGQNAGAQVLKSTIRYIYQNTDPSKIHFAYPVFDSLCFLIDKDYFDEFIKVFKSAMRPVLHYNGNSLQLKADFKTSETNWADLQSFDDSEVPVICYNQIEL